MQLGVGTCTRAAGVPGHLRAEPLTALGLLDRAVDRGARMPPTCGNLPLYALSTAVLDVLAGCAAEHGVVIEAETRGIAADHLRTCLALGRRSRSPILRVVGDTVIIPHRTRSWRSLCPSWSSSRTQRRSPLAGARSASFSRGGATPLGRTGSGTSSTRCFIRRRADDH